MEDIKEILGTILLILILISSITPDPPPEPEVHAWVKNTYVPSDPQATVFVRVTRPNGEPLKGTTVKTIWYLGNHEETRSSRANNAGLVRHSLPLSFIPDGQRVTVEVEIAANGRNYSHASATSFYRSGIERFEPYNGSFTQCQKGDRLQQCNLEELKDVLVYDIMRWTSIKHMRLWCGGNLTVYLTRVSNQMLVDAIRYDVVRGGKSEAEAQNLYNDIQHKLRRTGQAPFIARFDLQRGGGLFCNSPKPVLHLSRSSFQLKNDLMETSPVVRLTPGVLEGEGGYLFFNDIIDDTNSSFTAYLSAQVNGKDSDEQLEHKFTFNYDNTKINFSKLINDVSRERLEEMASSRLAGPSLGFDDALNMVSLVVGLITLIAP